MDRPLPEAASISASEAASRSISGAASILASEAASRSISGAASISTAGAASISAAAARSSGATFLVVPLAAICLLWPAIWNGYPIVFADTGTYLSQAVHRYLGWDRPAFYSMMMLPLHLTLTTWPVIVVQAILASCILRTVLLVLIPGRSPWWLVAQSGFLAVMTWFPWTVSELMPDLFTPLVVLMLSLLLFAEDRLSRRTKSVVVLGSAFMIATQQSSVALAAALIALLWPLAIWLRRLRSRQRHAAENASRTRAGGNAPWIAILPLILALLAMTAVNLVGHGRLSPSPFGNVFLLARLIHDGPARTVLERDCPRAGWRLCPYVQSIPATSDEFLWNPDSPVVQAGGHKAVSGDADAIIAATLRAYPMEVLSTALANTLHQLGRFSRGDGLEPWPVQVTPWMAKDFPHREYAAYQAARQQRGDLAVPFPLAVVHQVVAIAGIVGCILLLPVALRRRHMSAGFLAAALIALPISAAITGAMSMPHDRYQSRIMWLPSCVGLIALGCLRRHAIGTDPIAACPAHPVTARAGRPSTTSMAQFVDTEPAPAMAARHLSPERS